MLLALSEQGEETIALAHKLFPTYIGYIDNGLTGIVCILRQLAKDRAEPPGPMIKSDLRKHGIMTVKGIAWTSP